jgi:hypothetical protein
LKTNPYRNLGMAVINWGMCYTHWWKIPKYHLTAHS